MENDLSVLTRLELAKDWVRDAGNFLKENIAAPLEITEKTRYDDLVTNFDKEVQEQIVANILHHFPEDKILAEEDEEKIKELIYNYNVKTLGLHSVNKKIVNPYL